MIWTFTNFLVTKGRGEYTAMAWTQDVENLLSTSLRGIWKRREKVFDIKHFSSFLKANEE